MGLPHETLVSEDVGDDCVGRGGGEPKYQVCRRDHNRVDVSESCERQLSLKNVKVEEAKAGNSFVEFCECGGRSEKKKSVSPAKLFGSKRVIGSEGRIWDLPSAFVPTDGCVDVDNHNTHTLKTVQCARAPSSVIVGFDSQRLSSIPSTSTDAIACGVVSAISESNLSQLNHGCHGSLVRRKSSSPLASILSSDRGAGILEFSSEEDDTSGGRGELKVTGDDVDEGVFSSSTHTGRDERLGSKEKSIPIGVTGAFVRDQVPVTKERSQPVRVPAVLLRDGIPFSDGRMNAAMVSEAFAWAGVQAVTGVTDGPILAPRIGSRAKQLEQPGKNSSVIIERPHSERALEKFRPGVIECNSRWSPSPRPCLVPALSLSPLGPRWAISSKGNDNLPWESRTGCISPPRPRLLTWPGEFSSPHRADLQCEVEAHTSDTLDKETGVHCKYFLPEAPPKQGAPWSGLAWGLEATSAPAVVSSRSPSISAGPPIRRSLVGSFEESLLSGRFLSEKPCQKLDGFLAFLTVTGAGRSAPSRKLPFSVTCVDGDSPLLYYASIDISGTPAGSNLIPSKPASLENRHGNSRFRVPKQGRVQLVLSNPEKTPVHTFICSYDLSDMPPGTKTIMRHKVSLAGSSPRSSKHNFPSRGNTKIVSETPSESAPSCQNCSCPNHGPRVYSNPIRLEQDRDVSSDIVKTDMSLSRDTKGPHVQCGCYENCNYRPMYIESPGRICRKSIEYAKHTDGCEGEFDASHLKSDSRDGTKLHHGYEKMRDLGTRNTPTAEAEHISKNSDVKTLESAGSVLRYALHLRFMCPPLKQPREKNSGMAHEQVLETFEVDSSAKMRKGSDVKDERRFYIYGDLRVVFPQRRSDSDEGKLHVDYDFPSNPKYFEYSC